MIGKQLSHYKILDELGRGGMGIVYQAQDTKLDRVVALKVLPSAALSSDDDRARFYREAKAAAQLHHPNIASVFEIDEAVPEGSGSDDVRPFIAMEHIDGQTLEDLIKEGPLKLEEAVGYASQIAGALEVAHEKHIVHRDIKSANVMVTNRGVAKVLDFGLAKTVHSTMLTRMGSTVGTFAYMSPEQTQGEDVDDRTDLWALGVVLYELISGRLPFKGDYEQAITYSILNEDPEPLTAIRTGVPMGLEWIVSKLLAKDPADRYQSAQDLMVDLRTVDLTSSGLSRTSVKAVSGSVSRKSIVPRHGGNRTNILAFAIVGVLACILAAVAGYVLGGSDAQPERSAVRSNIILPGDNPIGFIGDAPFYIGQRALDISSDGTTLVYVVESADGQPRLATRQMDDYSTRIIPDTEGAFAPFISEDGRQVGFFANDQLKIVPIDGRSSTALIDVRNPQGGSWIDDGQIVYSDNEGERLRVIDIGSKDSRVLGGIRGINPSVVPGSREVLLALRRGNVGIISLESETLAKVVEVGSWGSRVSSPRYAESGHLLYMQDGLLKAIGFDLNGLETIGLPVTVVDDVRNETLGQGGQYSISSTGTMVYASGGNVALGNLVEANSTGRVTPFPFEPEQFGEMRLSPDGTQLAIGVKKTNWDIWVYDLSGNASPQRLTFEGENYGPVWHPDGSTLYFSSNRTGEWLLYVTSVDASGNVMPVGGNIGFRASAVTPDGRLLLGAVVESETAGDVVAIPLDDDAPGMKLAATEYAEWGAVPSPDGDLIAYLSDEGGTYDIFVKHADESAGRVRVSTGGGMDPVWSDGGDYVYFNNVREVYRAQVNRDSGINISNPELLFAGDFVDLGGKGWDYHEDSNRFVLVQSVEKVHTSTTLNVVSGFFSELHNRVVLN